MNLPEQRSDEDLATLLAQGDASASATLAQRYALGIYDFAIRVTLDPAAAASATETSLNRVAAEIGSRPRALSFRAWLFGIVRDESLEGLRQRSRAEGAPEEPQADGLAPMDARFIQTPHSDHTDAAAWAWSSARGQRPRDYSILDLLLRRHITPEEVAEIASLSRNGVYAVLGRLRGGFEESFVATALYTAGRHACPELDALLGDSISLGPVLRREVSRHAETCANCRETRANLPAAADVFAGLDEVELPDEVTDRLLPMMLAAGGPVAAPATESAAAAGALTAATGLAASEPGFASNGGEGSDAATEALDEEADSATLPEEVVGPAQVSLFEADTDSVQAADDQEEAEEPEPSQTSDPFDEDEDLVDEEADEQPEPGLPRPSFVSGLNAGSEDLSAEDEDEYATPAAVPFDAGDRRFEDEPATVYAEDNTPEPVAFDAPDEDEEDEEAYEDEEVARPAAARIAIFGQPAAEDTEDMVESTSERTGRLAASSAAASNLQRRRQRLQGSGQGNPPGGDGPFADSVEEGGSNRKKYFVYAIVAGLTLLALYLGIALGDSLKGGGGGGDSVASALATRPAGVTDVACPGPVQVRQGSRVALTFPSAPAGYELADGPGLRPVSTTSAANQVSVNSQLGNTILFQAVTVPNSAGRIDEYQVTATFAKGAAKETLLCTVRVLSAGSPVPATATRPPASPTPATPAPTATVPPAPTSTSAPFVQPTAVPTATPDLSTPTSSVPTPVPTAGGVLISPTETPTRTPTATQTKTP